MSDQQNEQPMEEFCTDNVSYWVNSKLSGVRQYVPVPMVPNHINWMYVAIVVIVLFFISSLFSS